MNISEKSLNDKIKNIAKENNIKDVNKVRTTLALERIVARLRNNKFLDGKLVFCGGFVLYKESITDRFTKDVDMISSYKDHEKIIEEIKTSLAFDLDDGFWFGDTLIGEIQDNILYGGIRFRPLYKIGTPFPISEKDQKFLKRIHLDLSFQNINDDMLEVKNLSSELKGLEEFSWQIYPLEYMAADKLHAIACRLGFSTRGKDVYDLSFVLPKCDINKLAKAVEHTFHSRSGKIENVYLSNFFKEMNTSSLRNSWNKLDIRAKNRSFDESLADVIQFLENHKIKN